MPEKERSEQNAKQNILTKEREKIEKEYQEGDKNHARDGGKIIARQNNSSPPDQFYFYALVAVHHILPVRLVLLPRPLYRGRVL